MKHNITLLKGDGIGPEISNSVVDIIESTKVEIDWDECLAGNEAYIKYGEVLPEKTLNSIKKNKIVLKAPITTPIGKGFASVNVQLRRYFDLFANIRPSKNLPNIKTPFNDVDLIIIRENTEDILHQEIGKTFVRVLEDAGVYKCTTEGRAAFNRFLSFVNQSPVKEGHV